MSRYGGGYDGGTSRGPPDISSMVSLKVDNLTYRTDREDLEKLFGKYGEVGDIYIPKDRNTHNSRGFAFVRFYESKDAEDAMESLDGKNIDGREIRVAMAKYGRPANQYDPRSGRRGGNDDQRRRRSPPRSRRRSRSRSPRRSRSRSRSPRYHRRSPSRSPRRASPSPRRSVSKSRSRSRSRSLTPPRRSP